MSERGEKQTAISGVNAEFLEELFEEYLADPGSVEPQWRNFFDELQLGVDGNGGVQALQSQALQSQALTPVAGGAQDADFCEPCSVAVTRAPVPGVTHREGLEGEVSDLSKQSAVFNLINTYRTFGHTRAALDPLGKPHMTDPPDFSLGYFGLSEGDLDCPFATGTLVAPPVQPLRDILRQLEKTYCGSIGVEYMPIRNQAQRRWLADAMESTWNQPKFDSQTRRKILTKLTHAEMFEKFLHTKFVGQKRFSLEGAETLIVMLDGLVEEAAEQGAVEVVMGMPHRGRLNTLVNVMDKKLEYIFSEFLDVTELDELTGSGDVKYHKGYSSNRITDSGKNIHLSLTFNPSHLEAVNPVVEGNVRAKQDLRGDTAGREIIPVLLHGDAAFAGQGLVHETLNLSQLEGYRTGGTIHVIVNNQIGFTTAPRYSRSFLYPSDVCKMLNIPVLHINGDDPEMVLHAVRLAVGYRQTFHTDIVLDLFCYRRHGHNETDEPGFTQPLTYKVIKNHPSSLEVYIRKLEEEGALKPGEAEEIRAGYNDLMNNALEATRRDNIKSIPETLSGRWSGLERGLMPKGIVTTEVTINCLLSVSEKASSVPDGFTHHPRLARLLKARKDMVEDRQPIDWGMGELLTYGSLLQEGFNVRLSGQDVKRGTFSHRHVNLVDVENGKDYIALQHLKEKQGRFEVHDSPLSEAGVLGFEFGYSLADPFCLTVWEAQFGDFANGAQVIIDQFIASSESKWLRMSGLVMLLPHGFEGQGPEHSSARMERYLQMCGEHNIQVCNVTTPAQFFHMMRRQMHRKFRKPLIVMSPKSLLRHPQAVSTTEDFIRGSFREMLYDKGDLDKKKVRRLAVCTGKVFYDLSAARDENGVKDVALARMEQVYPFPAEDLKDILSQYPALKEVVWVQEEPRNMGSWDFLEPRLREILGKKLTLEYVGRKPSSSPATGSNRAHQEEQKTLVAYALGIKAGSNSKKQG